MTKKDMQKEIDQLKQRVKTLEDELKRLSESENLRKQSKSNAYPGSAYDLSARRRTKCFVTSTRRGMKYGIPY